MFGSIVRGDDTESSDLDLLVDTTDCTSLFDLAAIELELERLIGILVHVTTVGALRGAHASGFWRKPNRYERKGAAGDGVPRPHAGGDPSDQCLRADIDLGTVWNTAQTNLPQLERQLLALRNAT